MKKWAVVILKVDNSLDWFSVYAENREEEVTQIVFFKEN